MNKKLKKLHIHDIIYKITLNFIQFLTFYLQPA